MYDVLCRMCMRGRDGRHTDTRTTLATAPVQVFRLAWYLKPSFLPVAGVDRV